MPPCQQRTLSLQGTEEETLAKLHIATKYLSLYQLYLPPGAFSKTLTCIVGLFELKQTTLHNTIGL